MYELDYVKKRKRKKWAVIIGGISGITISTFAIIAFLGKAVGTFTVSLETGNVKLALSQESSFLSSTSHLKADVASKFQEYTYSNFANYGDDVIDSEKTDSTLGANINKEGEVTSLNFYKYTFFVKNVGTSDCRYNFSLNITGQSGSSDGRTIDNTLRVTLYENSDASTHNKTTYGKRSATPHVNSNGEADYRSPISISESEATETNPFQGYAEEFTSSSVILSFQSERFTVNEVKRYTVVFWFEGYRSSNLEEAPEGAKMNLGVRINANEI